MKRFCYSRVAIAAVVLAALTATSAFAATTKAIPFTATYSGQASTNATGNIVAILANGTGKGTLIGVGKITGAGSGDSSQQPCVPFAGAGTMTGTGGTSLVQARLRRERLWRRGRSHVFSVTGHAVVLKATGKLAKAKGTLKFTGIFDHDDGHVLGQVHRDAQEVTRSPRKEEP